MDTQTETVAANAAPISENAGTPTVPAGSKSRRGRTLVLAVSIIILGFVCFYYLRSASSSSNQKSGLNSVVNSKIANVKFLLLDARLYSEYSSLYAGTNFISNIRSLTFDPANATIDLTSEISQANETLTASSLSAPQNRDIILKSIYSLGIPVNTSGASVSSGVSSFELAYLFLYIGNFIQQEASQLGFLFGCQLFNSTEINASFLYGLAVPYVNSTAFAFTGTATSTIDVPVYEWVSTIPIDWIGLMVDIENKPLSMIINGNSATCQNGESLSENELFYMLSLDQYESYLFSQMLYNTTIHPSIRLIAYTDNRLIVNLGNVNLSDNITALYVDGRQSNSVRFFNFLVSNESLSAGTHHINVTVDGNKLGGTLIVTKRA